MKKNIKKYLAIAVFTGMMCSTNSTYAAQTDDIDAMIQQQQQILQNLNEKKSKNQSEEIISHITELQTQLKEIKQNSNNYDSKGAIEALTGQLAMLQEQLAKQMDAQNKMLDSFKNFTELTNKRFEAYISNNTDELYNGRAATKKFLVNPGQGQQVSYTQDAINSQGNSTMIFSYAPNQLYKIYCRVGYLTDLELKKGEKINFVGGGDTSAWAINSIEVDGVPHLYIKPTVPSSTTNIIVTTNKHSYQIILNTSDWYNPMVRWTYEGEEHIANMAKSRQDEIIVTNTFSVSNYDSLNFEYEISGSKNYAPAMVFDDGSQTIIKYKKLSKTAPALFIKENGRKNISMVNYRIKDNCYIIDRLVSEAELRISDKEIVRIKRKN